MRFSTIPEMFTRLCDKYGDSRFAYLYKEQGVYRGISHESLREKVEGFALGLLSLGIHSYDRVGVVSENRIEWIIANIAISSIGAVDVPVFPILTARQEEFIFTDCQAAAIIVSNRFQLNKILEFKENLHSLRHVIVMNNDFDVDDVSVISMDSVINTGYQIRTPVERRKIINDLLIKIQPEDLLTIIYTSGTTGNPKGVMLTHKNIVSNINGSVEAVGFTDEDTFLSYLPWCHSYERVTSYAAFSCGAPIGIAESIEALAANIREIKPTLMTTVPRMLEVIKKRIYASMEKESPNKRKIFDWAVRIGGEFVRSKESGKTTFLLKGKYLLANKLVFSKIRNKLGVDSCRFVSGGAPLAVEVSEFFIALGYIVLEGFGLTEASPVVAVTRLDSLELGTVGKSLPGVEIKLGADGEVLVRGQGIMKGYWSDESATHTAIDEEGWLYTGDIGIFTAKGNLKITDRKKNIFISSGGKNIAPQPIENLLVQSPYIEQCILIGENREFNTALLTPDFEQLKQLADNFGISYQNVNELITNPKIIKAIGNELDRLQNDLAKFEKVRKFSLLSQPFSIENGELTPKLSVRRHVIERKYSELIEKMYGSE